MREVHKTEMSDTEAMIEDCLKRESKMNDWEQNFIQSISESSGDKSLTQKQHEILETIWERIT